MGVDVGYTVERALSICVFSVYLLIFIYQISLYRVRHIRKRYQLVKLRINLLCSFSSTLMIIHVIDDQGVYQLLPYIIVLYSLDICIFLMTLALAFAIHSHFEAHYLVSRKEIPKFIMRALFASCFFYCLCLLVADTLTYYLSQIHWQLLWEFGSLGWEFSTSIIDIYAYTLIRNLFSNEGLTTMDGTDMKNLNRIFYFHLGINGALTIFAAFHLRTLITRKDFWREGPYLVPKADDFSIATSTYGLLLTFPVFIWWTWTPGKSLDDMEGTVEMDRLSGTKETNARRPQSSIRDRVTVTDTPLQNQQVPPSEISAPPTPANGPSNERRESEADEKNHHWTMLLLPTTSPIPTLRSSLSPTTLGFFSFPVTPERNDIDDTIDDSYITCTPNSNTDSSSSSGSDSSTNSSSTNSSSSSSSDSNNTNNNNNNHRDSPNHNGLESIDESNHIEIERGSLGGHNNINSNDEINKEEVAIS